MIIQQQPPLHLTYCLNIHPGETWAENFAAIQEKALAVKARLSPDKPFGLGLRLSSRAAESLAAGHRRYDVRKFFDDHGLYAFTINGFPYGQFHDTRVKQNVYAPDWQTAERRDYTNLLADILADFLPDGISGSISTVPGSFKPWITGEDNARGMTDNLLACDRHLAEIREETGKNIYLALEPEPGCFLETTDETIAFFRERLGSSQQLGVCFDTCHAAVQFEDVTAALKKYVTAGVRVAKIQLSAALETGSDAETLKPFCDPVYLHQATERTTDGSLRRWSDLPEALLELERRPRAEPGGILRVHFHVPLFAGSSTATELTPGFFALVKSGITSHLEIETYTFSVLPAPLRSREMIESIVREYEWVLARIA